MNSRLFRISLICIATVSGGLSLAAQAQDKTSQSEEEIIQTRNNTTQTKSNVTQAESPTARTDEDNDVINVLTNDRQFSMFMKAFRVAGTSQILQDSGPFTVLAPTNDAFGSMPENKLEMLLKDENKEKLVQFLNHHVIAGVISAKELSQRNSLESVEGTRIQIEQENGETKVNEGKIVLADLKASNGVIHGIDNVLMPNMKKPE